MPAAAALPEALAGAVALAEVGGEAVVLRVQVPPGVGAGAVDVLAFEGEARAVGLGLAWVGAGEVHRVEVPAAVDTAGIRAKFSKKKATVTVTLPLLAAPAAAAPAEGELAALDLGRGAGEASTASGPASDPTAEPAREPVVHACRVPPRITEPEVGKQRKQDAERAKRAGKALAGLLKAEGWGTLDGFVEPEAVGRVRAEIRAFESQYTKGEIWVGQEGSGVGAQIARDDVRGDSVLWVDRMTLKRAPQLQSLRQLVRKIDNLVIGELRKRDPYLKFVEERSDPMLAIYPADGAGFKRHVDNSAGDGRVLTVLCYLNPSWEPERGGMLRLSPDGADGRPVDVCPVGGRLAMFYADRIAHEVMPSYEVRHAVTIWYYNAKERKAAVARGIAKVNAHAPAVAAGKEVAVGGRAAGRGGGPGAGAERQAQGFVQALVNEGLGAEALRRHAVAVSPEARRLVAEILGMPKPGQFSVLMDTLDEAGLAGLRQHAARMGLM